MRHSRRSFKVLGLSLSWLMLAAVAAGGCSGGSGAGPMTGSGGAPTASGGRPGLASGGAVGSGGDAPIGTGGGPGSGGLSGQPGSGGQPASTGGASATGGSGAVAGSGGAGATTSTGGRPGSGGGAAPDAGIDAVRPPVSDGGLDATTDADQSSLPNLTLHLAGDSTVMTYAADSLQEGWGQELPLFLNTKVKINNQALGGASVQSFFTGSRWTNITGAVKAGDYVMIQFGANDSGSVAGRHVEVPDFAAILGQMIDQIKAKQATPILVTPSAFREWSGSTATNVRLGPYAKAMLALGPTKGVLVDDLNARGVELLNRIGMSGAAALYIGVDKAHFTKMGAIQMAQFVAEELRRIGSPLGAYVK